MKQKIIFSAVFALAGIIAVFGLAKAQTTTDDDTAKTRAEIQAERRAEINDKINDKKQAIEDRQEDRQQVREEKMEQICKNVEARIRTRVNRYENNKKANMNVFSNMVTRLNKVVERFQALGLDTEKLEADIKTLQKEIDELEKTHDSFISELGETGESACGKSQGEFRAKLGEARSIAPKVRGDVIEIRKFYQSTIRPEILELRDQIDDEEDVDDEQDADDNEE